ncbi:Uncharacterised protein [Yersinia pekkanenii]|uniref:Uncharacterized protein n=1 Tax=Yersinia pekkanenii TaxID=1288385 RepID=A0A0T9RML3_9GAMM|nr:Uncharacterised protein [Yersinia pekkanenii]CRY69799.1 Uncharacterised protein [Yersinia pekkanenii]
MANLEKAVNEFNCISKSMGYNINPPYTGHLGTYDFGREISQSSLISGSDTALFCGLAMGCVLMDAYFMA